MSKITLPHTLELPSGKTAVINSFKGRDAMQAQRLAGTDSEKYIPALIVATTTIDGEKVIIEDLEEMDGMDYLKLMTAFSEAFL